MKSLITKIIACIAAALLLAFSVFFLFRIVVEKRIDCRTTYIAARDIEPRTQITEEDLIEVEIPEQYLLDYAYTDAGDIIGKYTDIQGKIPAGSPFYKTMLYNAHDLPDDPEAQLKEGQTIYTSEVDLTDLGSVTAGMRVDIYVSIERRDTTALTGCLIANARVIHVKDHQGLSMEDEESSGIPYMIEVAVNSEDLQLLTLAETEGKIRFFPSVNTYSTDNEASLKSDSAVTMYLQEQRDSSWIAETESPEESASPAE